MNKTAYIFILLLFTVNFWNIGAFSILLNQDIQLVVLTVVMLIGFLTYRKQNFIDKKKYSWFYKLIIAGIVLSLIPLVLFRGQGLVESVLVYRNYVGLLIFPLLFYIQPKPQEIITALKWNCIFTIFFVLLSIVDQSLFFVVDEAKLLNEEQRIARTDSYDTIILASGNGLLFYVYYAICLMNMIKKPTPVNVNWVIVCYGITILYQNRQQLILATLLLLYAVWHIRERKWARYLMVVGGILLFFYSIDMWQSLFFETADDVDNKDTGRMASLVYFLFQHNQNIFEYILGNGMPTLHSQYGQMIFDLGERFAIWSGDLGVIGIWSNFGILPLIAIYALCIRVLKKQMLPYSLKFVATFPFVIPFLQAIHNFQWLCFWAFFVYLYAFYDTAYKKQMLIDPKFGR